MMKMKIIVHLLQQELLTLLFLGGEKSFGVPNSVILTACAFGLAVIISRFTSGGRRLYAVGSNAVAARAAGIDPGAVKRRMFMVAGGIAGVAGNGQANSSR
mgnify:CR=1 FL=1